MVAIGSAALPLRRSESLMEEGRSHKRGRKKMGMSRKPEKQGRSFDANVSKNVSGRGSSRESYSVPQTSVVRYYMMSCFNDGFLEWWSICEWLAF